MEPCFTQADNCKILEKKMIDLNYPDNEMKGMILRQSVED